MSSKNLNYKQKRAFVTETDAFKAGRVDMRSYGQTIARYTHWFLGKARASPSPIHEFILNVGPVRVGMNTCFGGVIPGRWWFFLGRAGRVWKVPKHRLPGVAPSPVGLDERNLAAWADIQARAIVEAAEHPSVVKVVSASQAQYSRMVRTLVEQRCIDASAVGYTRSHQDYARGVCEDWTSFDLTHPRVPTVRHALCTSLVLGLEAQTAAQLIELAAIHEYRMPLVNREIALSIYTQAAHVLGMWVPAWLLHGYLLDWSKHGCIDAYMRQWWASVLKTSMMRGVDLGIDADIDATRPREARFSGGLKEKP